MICHVDILLKDMAAKGKRLHDDVASFGQVLVLPPPPKKIVEITPSFPNILDTWDLTTFKL